METTDALEVAIRLVNHEIEKIQYHLSTVGYEDASLARLRAFLVVRDTFRTRLEAYKQGGCCG